MNIQNENKRKMLRALERVIAVAEEIVRLETEAITEHSRDFFRLLLNDPAAPLTFFGLIFDGPVPPIKRPIDINGRIELMKYSPEYRDLYRRRDKIQEEIKKSKRGRPPEPEICLDLIEAIVAFSLTAIGHPTSDPTHLFKRLRADNKEIP